MFYSLLKGGALSREVRTGLRRLPFIPPTNHPPVKEENSAISQSGGKKGEEPCLKKGSEKLKPEFEEGP